MLTESAIKKELKEGRDVQLSDGKGRGTGRLVLRVKNGKADWYAQQWIEDDRRMSKIGSYPTINLSAARLEFATRFQPSIIQLKEIENAQPIGTVKELFDAYVSNMKANGQRSVKEVEGGLRRIAAAIGNDKPANKVTTKDIVEAIRPIYNAGYVSMADHMRAYVRAAYGWALKTKNDYRSKTADRFKLTGNPAENIPTERPQPGTRWLTVDELRKFWRWEGTQHPWNNSHPKNYIAVKMLILTGQRLEEIARLHTSMVNRDALIIEWPKTKNGKAHVLPITEPMLHILEQAVPNEHGFYFWSEVFPDRYITNQTIRLICTRYCEITKCKPFTARDLRRTCKTLSGQAGLTKDDRDRLQNHARGDVSSVHYDRYDYMREKRAAMEQWSDWILSRL